VPGLVPPLLGVSGRSLLSGTPCVALRMTDIMW
jgi:hypothetical protein